MPIDALVRNFWQKRDCAERRTVAQTLRRSSAELIGRVKERIHASDLLIADSRKLLPWLTDRPVAPFQAHVRQFPV